LIPFPIKTTLARELFIARTAPLLVVVSSLYSSNHSDRATPGDMGVTDSTATGMS
jgi:hypothetical protein